MGNSLLKYVPWLCVMHQPHTPNQKEKQKTPLPRAVMGDIDLFNVDQKAPIKFSNSGFAIQIPDILFGHDILLMASKILSLLLIAGVV